VDNGNGQPANWTIDDMQRYLRWYLQRYLYEYDMLIAGKMAIFRLGATIGAVSHVRC